MKFGDRLRYCRKAAKLTQEQFAHKLGWSGQSRVANYESTDSDNSREPPLDELPAMADVLNVPVGVLIDQRAFDEHKGSMGGGKPSGLAHKVLPFPQRNVRKPSELKRETNTSTSIDPTALLRLILTQVQNLDGLTTRQRDTLIVRVFKLALTEEALPSSAKVLKLLRSA